MSTPQLVATGLGRLQVTTTGSGPAAVLWHSLFIDSRSWQHVLPALAEHRTLILINGPSHGGSDPAQRVFTLGECARAAMDVLDVFGVSEPVDWVGSAWGGHVGLLFAAQCPQRLRTLTMIGTPVHDLTARERLRLVPMVGLYRVVGPTRPLVNATIAAMVSDRSQPHAADAADIIATTLRDADRHGYHLTMKSAMLRRPDLTGALKDLRAPALFIVGGDDPMNTPRQAEAATRRVERADLAVIPGTRHLPALEAPKDVASLVAAFWADHDR